MYTQQDYDRAQAQFQRAILISAAILMVGVVAMVAALIIRSRVATCATAVLTGWMVYGYLSLKLMPHYLYRKYLLDIRSGRSRESEGYFVSVSGDTRRVDGVQVHDVLVRVGEAADDDRLFYWDDDKPLPAIAAGQPVRINSFGNFIIELTQLQPEGR